jgi:HEPN domain-containing protein
MKEKRIDHVNLGAWLGHAEADYQVAKMNELASFIRSFHAQQAIEKLLKALIIAKEGKFINKSLKLMAYRSQFKEKIPDYMPDCGWEMDTELAITHDLNRLVERVQESGDASLAFLEEHKIFLKELSDYAVIYRYPYYLKEVGMVVEYVKKEKVDMIMKGLDLLYHTLKNNITHMALST